jgi:hypothetical protein
VKRGVVQSLYHRAATICQEQTDCCDDIDILSHDLQLSAYLIGFIDLVINRSKRNIRLKEVWPLGFASERHKCIANRYSIRTDFKTKHTLTNSVMRTRPIRTPKETANCVYCIPCEWGRSYVEDTGRPWAVRLWEHRQNLGGDHLEISR